MTRWTRFATVGAMGFAVQLVALYALTTVVRMAYEAAVVLAVEAAILHNFVWHERWTWRDRVATASLVTSFTRLLRFNAATGIVSVCGNVILTALFVELFGMPVMAANFCAIACLSAANFVVADRLTFVSAPAALFTLVVIGTTAVDAHGAEPPTETIAAWNHYVARVEARRAGETPDRDDFHGFDRVRLERGDVIVDNVAGASVAVPGGTISHWRGAVLVPGVTLEPLLEGAALRGGRVRHPEDVVAARVLDRDGDTFRLFLKLRRQAIVTVAYNTEHQVTIRRLGPTTAAIRSVSTRIAELADVGTPREREKPAEKDRGFMWRLHSYWWYQAIPGGVIIELESMTLSRDVPWALRAIAGPIVDRIARDSVTRTLTALR